MKLRKPFSLPSLALAALLCGGTAAHAEMTFYSSQASFQAAVTAPVTDRFDDLFWAQGPGSLYREPGGGYSYVVNALAFDGSENSTLLRRRQRCRGQLAVDQPSHRRT